MAKGVVAKVGGFKGRRQPRNKSHRCPGLPTFPAQKNKRTAWEGVRVVWRGPVQGSGFIGFCKTPVLVPCAPDATTHTKYSITAPWLSRAVGADMQKHAVTRPLTLFEARGSTPMAEHMLLNLLRKSGFFTISA
jgi:hypothetical protein